MRSWLSLRALAHQDREGARRNLRIKRPAIARLDAVEGLAAVGDEPREHVDPPGRAFRVGGARKRATRNPHVPAAARYRRSPFPAPRRCVRSISCMKTDGSLSATVAFGPGRKLARTRQAMAPSRRSMLAGWICPSSKSSVASISRRARISRRSTWLGKMPVEWRPYWSPLAGFGFAEKIVVRHEASYRGAALAGHSPVPRNPRISAIVSASPQRRTGASGGKAESSREGVAGSRITKQPLSALRADQPPERLLQAQPRQQVVIGFAESRAARLVQDGGLGPRHLVEHDKPQANAPAHPRRRATHRCRAGRRFPPRGTDRPARRYRAGPHAAHKE